MFWRNLLKKVYSKGEKFYIEVEGLKGNPGLGVEIEEFCDNSELPGTWHTGPNPETGVVYVEFDSNTLSKEDILKALDKAGYKHKEAKVENCLTPKQIEQKNSGQCDSCHRF